MAKAGAAGAGTKRSARRLAVTMARMNESGFMIEDSGCGWRFGFIRRKDTLSKNRRDLERFGDG